VRLAAGGDRAFEIADPVVGFCQDAGEGGERVATCGDGAAGAVVEHDVAGEDQGDRFGGNGCALASRQKSPSLLRSTAKKGQFFASFISHQYCSSPSRTGS
jgi:hypothetical protein